MEFQEFKCSIPQLITAELPGDYSHLKMAPFDRNPIFETIDLENKGPISSAVMMLCYPKKGDTHIVLIVRNAYKGVHSSQIGFPGGKFEPEDEHYAKTALRETEEEVGIQRESIEILRSFTPLYIPPSNFMVYPFLGICEKEINFVPNPFEVDSLIEIPLATFLKKETIITTTITNSYLSDIVLPAFKIDNYIVWGATAMILSELKDVLGSIMNSSN